MGKPGHDLVEEGFERIFQSAVGDGRGKPVGDEEGGEFRLAEPETGELIGGVLVRESPALRHVAKRRPEPVLHECDVALGRLAGDLEFLREAPGIGIFLILDVGVEPEETLVDHLG